MDAKSNLLIFIKEKNLSKTDFYKKTGLSNGFLDKGGSVTSANLETILNSFPEISLDWLVTGRGPMLRSDLPAAHLVTEPGTGIPLIPIDAVAGLPVGESLAARFIDCAHYVIPEFANLNVEYMIRVSGSSMYPKYSNGDILACRRVQDVLFFQWGKIYVIDSSQGALVKRVFQDEDPDRILLVSDNRENYPPFSIPKSDIRSLSIVVGVIRLE
jgi:phage repressor protein C with HTH and peptisase S24 domain